MEDRTKVELYRDLADVYAQNEWLERELEMWKDRIQRDLKQPDHDDLCVAADQLDEGFPRIAAWLRREAPSRLVHGVAAKAVRRKATGPIVVRIPRGREAEWLADKLAGAKFQVSELAREEPDDDLICTLDPVSDGPVSDEPIRP